jgi:hypothetical protein
MPIKTGQADVQEDHIRFGFARLPQARSAVIRGMDLVTQHGNKLGERRYRVHVVIDYQDTEASWHARSLEVPDGFCQSGNT